MKIKEIVKDNSVKFHRYRKGVIYYSVPVKTDGKVYMFPVPLEDVGDATLEASDKAMMFMRYIRKAIDEGTFVKADLKD